MDSRTLRPPEEASSWPLPVTIGCSHNGCLFCGMYRQDKFRVRGITGIDRDIDLQAQRGHRAASSVFLTSGDALSCPHSLLAGVLVYLKGCLPRVKRVSTYASPGSVILKSHQELRELRRLGLKMAYLGVETGDEELLKEMNKGATREQIVEASQRLKQAGIITAVSVILGLGGATGSERHALATGDILRAIAPDVIRPKILKLVPSTVLYHDWQEGRFTPISKDQALEELEIMVGKGQRIR